ncbi:MAG: hypothetical protein ABW046_15645 [Actinoplanes sp.]
MVAIGMFGRGGQAQPRDTRRQGLAGLAGGKFGLAGLVQRTGGVGDAGGHRVGRGLAQPDRPQQRQQVLISPRTRPGRH